MNFFSTNYHPMIILELLGVCASFQHFPTIEINLLLEPRSMSSLVTLLVSKVIKFWSWKQILFLFLAILFSESIFPFASISPLSKLNTFVFPHSIPNYDATLPYIPSSESLDIVDSSPVPDSVPSSHNSPLHDSDGIDVSIECASVPLPISRPPSTPP